MIWSPDRDRRAPADRRGRLIICHGRYLKIEIRPTPNCTSSTMNATKPRCAGAGGSHGPARRMAVVALEMPRSAASSWEDQYVRPSMSDGGSGVLTAAFSGSIRLGTACTEMWLELRFPRSHIMVVASDSTLGAR